MGGSPWCDPLPEPAAPAVAVGVVQGQLGNPEGPDKPNKKYIDPRAWLHAGEKGITARLLQAFKDLGSFGKFQFVETAR